VALAALAFAVSGLVGCSSGDVQQSEAAETLGQSEPSESASVASSPTESQSPADAAPSGESTPDQETSLDAAVRNYSDAYFGKDLDGVFGRMSTRCQGVVDKNQLTGELMAIDVNYPDGTPTLTSVTVNVDGDQGHATYSYSDGLQINDQPWALEEGTWKYDQCED
jgi:hypothetical protein